MSYAARGLLFGQAEGGIRGLTVTGVQTCALPICCRTVVSPGLVNAAPGMSSKPTTEISCGTRNPSSRNAQIDPIAEISLYAKSAVNGCFLASSCMAKGYPIAGVESVPSNWMVNSGRMQIPSSCAASQMASHRTAESEL